MQLSTVVILLAFISVCWAQATLFIGGGRCIHRGDDHNSGVIGFRYGDFSLFGKFYSQYVVHSNGYMTVTNSRSTVVYDSKDIVNLTSLTNGPMIAAFWGDVDNRAGGEISYRETRDIRDLTMATMIISNANNNFVATSLVVATWKNVGYYDRHGEKRNTFQVVLANGIRTDRPNNRDESYIIFLYNSIGWNTTDSATQDGSLPAQVGFTAGDGSNDTRYLPRFSDSLNGNIERLQERLARLPQGDNTGIRGVYVCRSDMPGPICTALRAPRVKLQEPYPIDEFVTPSQARANALARSQARANALARFSSHPEYTQLYEEDVEAMEMELDSISNDPSKQDNEPQDQVNKAEVYTEYNEDKNTFETDK